MNTLRHEAEILRDKGYSYNMITEELGIARSTMSYWFRNRPFTPNKKVLQRIQYGPIKAGTTKHNTRVKEVAELRSTGIAEVGSLSKRDLWMLGIGIYIGEGAKSIESVRIMNSDPKVIAISMRWLIESCSLTRENIIISMHLYPDNDIQDCMRFWSGVTGLNEKNFRKTQIDLRTDKSRNGRGKLPYGTVQLRVHSLGNRKNGVVLFRKIMGWIDGVLREV